MQSLLDRLGHFLAELKRRKVYRVAVAYLAVVFIGLQAVDLLVPATTLPPWVDELLIALAVFGFSVALVLAWAFEVTPEGVKRAPAVYEADRPDGDAGRGRAATRRRALLLGGLLVGTLAIGGYAFLRMGGPSEDQVSEIRSLAILPLDNLSGDPQQAYFTDGMTEALIAELGQIEALKVISRTSAMHYRDSEKRLPEIGRELGVEGIIEGSVLKAADEVRIILQLVHAPTDRQLWSQSYQRHLREILSLQSDIARTVAGEIEVTLAKDEEARLSHRQTVNPRAYELWLKGNYHLTQLKQSSFRQARDLYAQASAIQPDYAPAHAGMAMALIALGGWHASLPPQEAFPDARNAAQRALALDSTLAEGHIAIARIRQLFDWDWAGARSAYERGIALTPSATHARVMYANFLTAMGEYDKSIKVGQRTVELNPLSPQAHNELAFALWFEGREEEAREQIAKGLEIDPEFPQSHLLLADYHLARGEQDRALAHAARLGPTEEIRSSGWLGILGHQYAMAGQRGKAHDILTRLTEMRENPDGYVLASALALCHLGLGRQEEAVRWLERAYDERDVALVWLYKHPWYDPVRSNPRFQAILKRMNFPDT